MTRELSPLFHMGDEVIPDLQSRSSCGGAPVGKELPRRWQLANPKWYVRSVTGTMVSSAAYRRVAPW